MRLKERRGEERRDDEIHEEISVDERRGQVRAVAVSQLRC